MKSDLVDITCFIHHQTKLAVLVSLTGDREDAVWLPKEAIEIDNDGDARHADVTVTMPERLAIDKGLV